MRSLGAALGAFSVLLALQLVVWRLRRRGGHYLALLVMVSEADFAPELCGVKVTLMVVLFPGVTVIDGGTVGVKAKSAGFVPVIA